MYIYFLHIVVTLSEKAASTVDGLQCGKQGKSDADAITGYSHKLLGAFIVCSIKLDRMISSVSHMFALLIVPSHFILLISYLYLLLIVYKRCRSGCTV